MDLFSQMSCDFLKLLAERYIFTLGKKSFHMDNRKHYLLLLI